jgi:pimeloyl-ACP methyl ester carboxylesterase
MAVRVRNLENNRTNVRMIQAKQTAIRFLLTLLWYSSPDMAVRFVKKHIFSPADYQVSKEEGHILATGTKFQINVHGKTVQGWQWGEGPGVLFVHGWNGRGIQFHRYFGFLRRAGCAVIAFDAPAHGESGGKTSSYFEWTDAVRAILNSPNGFNIQAMIGHSLGGSAAINALSKEKMALPTALVAPALRLKEVLFNTFDLYGIPKPVYRKAIKNYEQRFGYSLERDNPSRLLSAFGGDLLIVHDCQDQTVPFEDSREAAATRPNVVLHETKGLGHRRILEDRRTMEFITGYIMGQIASTQSVQHEDRRPLQAVQPLVRLSNAA